MDTSTDYRENRKEQLAEVSVFVFLIGSSMVLSFYTLRQVALPFVLIAISVIFRDLALVSLILFFIWRNHEPVTRIGWTFKNCKQEIALGIILFIPFTLGTGLLKKGLLALGFSVPSTALLTSFLTARGMVESLLALVLVVIVALAEETIFRGYLLHRLRAVTANPTMAVLLSAVIFSLGHVYEGSAAVVTVGVMGVVLAFIYFWRKSLVAPMVMHFLQDFVVIILLPMLGGG